MDNKFLKQIPIYITTSDRHMPCLQAFCYLFNKFWSNEVTINILGYATPTFNLPSNVNYISLGIDRGPQYWSSDMLDFFSSINNYVFFLTNDDGFLIKKLNIELLHDAFVFSKMLSIENDNFLRFCLTHCVSTRAHEFVKNTDHGGQIIKSQPGTDYRFSIQHSLWNTKNFLKILKPNTTPWQLELDENARYSRFDIYGFINNCPLHIGHGYSKGQKINNWYEDFWRHVTNFQGLDRSEINFIESNNWIPETNLRIELDNNGAVINYKN